MSTTRESFICTCPRATTLLTHLPSRTVFIDADHYINDESLGYWLAHELGHLATNSPVLSFICYDRKDRGALVQRVQSRLANLGFNDRLDTQRIVFQRCRV